MTHINSLSAVPNLWTGNGAGAPGETLALRTRIGITWQTDGAFPPDPVRCTGIHSNLAFFCAARMQHIEPDGCLLLLTIRQTRQRLIDPLTQNGQLSIKQAIAEQDMRHVPIQNPPEDATRPRSADAQHVSGAQGDDQGAHTRTDRLDRSSKRPELGQKQSQPSQIPPEVKGSFPRVIGLMCLSIYTCIHHVKRKKK